MFLETLLATCIGIALGIFTGMTPGIHINLVAAIMLSLSPTLTAHFPPLTLAIAIIVMSITHVFVDFIPSIFLGAPSDATALAVLPGHKMLLEGRGYEAALLSAIGGFFSILGIILVLPALIIAVPTIFNFLKPHIGILLIGLAAYNVIKEKTASKKFWSFTVFIMAGTLGAITLNIPELKQPLLPMLAGLFGVSTLIESSISNATIPAQTKLAEKLNKKDLLRSTTAGAFSGAIISILPALGPAQSAMLAKNLFPKAGKKAYLTMLGAVSTSSMLFGLVTLFTINKARNGSIAILSEIVQVNQPEFIILTISSLTAAGLALLVTMTLGTFFAKNIHKINYRKISTAIILFITCLTLLLTGPTGIIVLATATAIGTFTISKDVPRHNLMGCLMLPVIIYYL